MRLTFTADAIIFLDGISQLVYQITELTVSHEIASSLANDTSKVYSSPDPELVPLLMGRILKCLQNCVHKKHHNTLQVLLIFNMRIVTRINHFFLAYTIPASLIHFLMQVLERIRPSYEQTLLTYFRHRSLSEDTHHTSNVVMTQIIEAIVKEMKLAIKYVC